MLTKLLTIAAVLLLSVVAAWPRERRQLFDGQVDTKQVGALLRNEAFVRTQMKCAMATDIAATALCDRIGHLIRKNIAPAIRTLECPGNCTVAEFKAIVEAYDIFTDLYPAFWKQLLDHYKITDAQLAGMVKWIENARAMPLPNKPEK